MTSPRTQHPAPAPPPLDPKPAPRTSSTTLRTRSSHSRIHVLHLHADRALLRQKPLPRPRRCDLAAATQRSRSRSIKQPTPHARPRLKLAETSTRAREITTRATPQLALRPNRDRASPPPALTPPTTATGAETPRHRARHTRWRGEHAPQHARAQQPAHHTRNTKPPQHVAHSKGPGSSKRAARLAPAHPRPVTSLHGPDAPQEGSPSGTMQHPVPSTAPGGQLHASGFRTHHRCEGHSHQQHNRARMCSTVEGGP